MLIAAEVVFLIFHSDSHTVRLLISVGIALGFLSHLCPGRDLRRPVERFQTGTQPVFRKRGQILRKEIFCQRFHLADTRRIDLVLIRRCWHC